MKKTSVVLALSYMLAAGLIQFADASAVRNCRVTAVVEKCANLPGKKYEISFKVINAAFENGHSMDTQCLVKDGAVYTTIIDNVKDEKAIQPGKKITLSHITVYGQRRGEKRMGKSTFWRYPAE